MSKTVGGVESDYIRDPSGNTLAIYGAGCGNSCWARGYIRANGHLFAEYGDSTTYFVQADHLGSTRLMTAMNQSVHDSMDYLPFGEQIAGDTGTTRKFTGKERDSETGLDNFGARYNSSSLGRFMSADPDTATPLHIINPQRWNMYSYGLNNPLSFTDPSGRDAIAVNFSKEIPVGGHEGIIAVDSNGTATYSRFGPNPAEEAFGKGQVQSFILGDKVRFDKNGLPTQASLAAVARDAAEEEHQDPSTVRLNYFKTTPEETSSLLDWIRRNQAASDAGNAPDYSFNYCNCAAFTIAGLIQAGAIKSNALISLIPNVLFDRLALLANENYVPPPHKPKPHVTYRILRWWFP